MTEHVDDLLALYALGGLEPEEAARVEAHLAGCAACRAEAGAMRAVVSAIAQSAPAAQPRETAREEILKRIASRSPRPASASAYLRWLPRALGLAALAALLGWNVYLNAELTRLHGDVQAQIQQAGALLQQATAQAGEIEALRQQVEAQRQVVGLVTAPNTHVYNLASQGPMPDASGRVYVDEAARSLVVIVNHLRPLGPDETYQLWVITADGPQPSALFTVNQNGWGMTRVEVDPALADFNAIGVSVEPTGGSRTPTEVVLAGGL